MNLELTDEIKSIVAELFSWPKERLSDSSGPGDVPRWDSLGHIQLLEALVERFSVAIPIEQAIEAQSIGDFVRIVATARAASE